MNQICSMQNNQPLRRKLHYGAQDLVGVNELEDEDLVEGNESEQPLSIIEDKEENETEHQVILEINNDKEIISREIIPEIGIEFSDKEKAYEFYNKYANSMGFGTRRSSYHKKNGVILDRIFCCTREGKRPNDKHDAIVKSHRAVMRCECKAHMKISCRGTKKYEVVQFVPEHNHEMTSPIKTKFFRSHRKITAAQKAEIDMVKSCGLPQKQILEVMSMQVGGLENLGFTRVDLKNYLQTKITIPMLQGDTGGLLEFLQKSQVEDPNFLYAIQVDIDDLITNIFWTDAKMRIDYACFGDVVCFDTTYRKHKDGRPIALFVGVNHHKQTTIFGAALLYDETTATFEWLFETFSIVMMGKTPKTMLTDQDHAMSSALASKWPSTQHRLCIWHIFQNAAAHLSNVFVKSDDFANDFSRCIYDYEEEDDFLCAWNEMLEKHDLKDNTWLKKLFEIKEKWALVYGRQIFCADMVTTQRSETMNSVLKTYVNYKNNLLEFFENFQRLLSARRNEESEADFKGSQSAPAMTFPVKILKHAADVYTFEVFEKFKLELCKGIDCMIENYEEVGTEVSYRVTDAHKRHHHLVKYDSSKKSVCCSCKKFEFAGILCAHVLKVFTTFSITRIPDEYILHRWTKSAKIGMTKFCTRLGGEVDEKERMSSRYRELCYLFMQLVTKATESDETYEIVKDDSWKMSDKMDAVSSKREKNGAPRLTNLDGRVGAIDTSNETNLGNRVGVINISGVDESTVKGVKPKSRVTYKTSRRPRNALEKAIKKCKCTSKEKPSKKDCTTQICASSDLAPLNPNILSQPLQMYEVPIHSS